MAQERTEAIVLRGVDFSETSRIVTLLTPGRGRMACLAKGVRRKNSALAAPLDAFNRIEIVYYWKDGREVQTLAEAALLDGFEEIKHNLEKVTFAALPLEMAGKTTLENEPSGASYAILANGLRSLASWQGDVRWHVCWQEAQLLRAAGFEPTLDCCVACGAAVREAFGFSYDGGVTCANCRFDRRLTTAEPAALRALFQSETRCPDEMARANLFGLLREYSTRQLDADFRSVRVIAQLFG